jgi:hypothetical protein
LKESSEHDGRSVIIDQANVLQALRKPFNPDTQWKNYVTITNPVSGEVTDKILSSTGISKGK